MPVIDIDTAEDGIRIGLRYTPNSSYITLFYIELMDPNTNELYDIEYKVHNIFDTFHIINTDIHIAIGRRPRFSFSLSGNGIGLDTYIVSQTAYLKIKNAFKSHIATVKAAHLNKLNNNEHLLPANIRALIGTQLTGHTGTFAQQRAAINREETEGGKRKTRKQRK
jgi:hypothetical protein